MLSRVSIWAPSRAFSAGWLFRRAFQAHQCIIQGCSLSMLMLQALKTTLIEEVSYQPDDRTPRACADDISFTFQCRFQTILKTKVTHLHAITEQFVGATGMTLNHRKRFTFGSPKAKSLLDQITTRKEQFRLVGGSFKLDGKHNWTQLEQE